MASVEHRNNPGYWFTPLSLSAHGNVIYQRLQLNVIVCHRSLSRSRSYFRPYFFITSQIAQVALPIWIALTGQLGQSGQQQRNTATMSSYNKMIHWYKYRVVEWLTLWKEVTRKYWSHLGLIERYKIGGNIYSRKILRNQKHLDLRLDKDQSKN